MTTETVLLLGLFAFILGGVFFNQSTGPVATFQASGPRLGAIVERDVSVGCGCDIEYGGIHLGFYKFNSATGPGPAIQWSDPTH